MKKQRRFNFVKGDPLMVNLGRYLNMGDGWLGGIFLNELKDTCRVEVQGKVYMLPDDLVRAV